jgi:hypothetical protein
MFLGDPPLGNFFTTSNHTTHLIITSLKKIKKPNSDHEMANFIGHYIFCSFTPKPLQHPLYINTLKAPITHMLNQC